MNEERERGHRFRWRPIISSLVLTLLFYFLGRQFVHHYGELSKYQWEIRYPLFLLSFVFLFGNYVLEAWIWKKLLDICHVHLSVSRCFTIINLSQLGKYIPGKFWIYLGQFYLGAKEGIPKGIIVFSNFFLLILLTAGGITVFSLSSFLWPRGYLEWASGLLGFVIAVLILLHPRVFIRIAKPFKHWVGIPKVDYSYSKMFYLFFLVLLDWAIYLVGFYFFLESFYSVTLRELIIFTGIFAISGLLGLYSLITPGGLGVREGAQAYLMSMFVPVSLSILVSIFSRVWMIMGEVIAAIFSLILRTKH